MKTAQIMGTDYFNCDNYYLLRDDENLDLDGLYVYTDYDEDDNLTTFKETCVRGQDLKEHTIMSHHGDDPEVCLNCLGYEVIGSGKDCSHLAQKVSKHIDEDWERAAKRKQNELWRKMLQ